MQPLQTASNYDRLARFWAQLHTDSDYGVEQLKRAISFTSNKEWALDVGCGSSGRFIELLHNSGFSPEGLDVSNAMIAIARERHPNCTFYVADIASWIFPRQYDLITAWDSTFHLPLTLQELAFKNICTGLASEGIFLFTCGGSDEPEIVSGGFQGETFRYSTLGITAYLQLLDQCSCVCKHLEFDQGPDGNHVYIIAQKCRPS